jgi:hypothetical protein
MTYIVLFVLWQGLQLTVLLPFTKRMWALAVLQPDGPLRRVGVICLFLALLLALISAREI